MAIVNKVDFKLKVEITLISNSDLDFLAVLAKNPKIEISKFCILLTELNIFKSSQSARNAISKAEKKGLVNKNGNNKKTITLNKDINVQSNGLVLLDYKILGSES